jgi:hypothetical protein
MNNRRRCRPLKPIFQEPDADQDGECYQGFVLGGMAGQDPHELARGYMECGDAVAGRALKLGELAYQLGYQALFFYRHAVELYLKFMVPHGNRHELAPLVDALERLVGQEFGEQLPEWFRGPLDEFARLDPGGTAFRYADEKAAKGLREEGEWYVDFRNLRRRMKRVAAGFEKIIAERHGRGRPAGRSGSGAT